MRNSKELLIVICTLTIFLLLLTGMTKINTPKAQSIKCQSNLKQLKQLADKYSGINNGRIVTYVDKSNKAKWKFWYDFLLPHSSSTTIFYCPSNPTAQKTLAKSTNPLIPTPFSSEAQSYGLNYKFNPCNGTLNRKEFYQKDIVNPRSMIYFGDSNTPFLRPTKACWASDYAPRHEGKSINVVMVDGSVRNLSKPKLTLSSKGTGKFWDGWLVDKTIWGQLQ